jgi:DNA gyrase subunit A
VAREEDFIADAFVASTHAYLLAFTSLGKVYWVKVHELPLSGPQSKGRPIINLIQMAENEKVRAILPVRAFPSNEGEAFVVTATRRGKIKKSDLVAYSNPRSIGLIACGIEPDDELISVKITNGKQEILLSTKDGMAIRFEESDVRVSGRPAVGVKGIGIRDGDEVVSMEILTPGANILTVTEYGYGKRTILEEYRKQSRGGMGVITIKTDDRNGRVADAVQVLPGDEVMIITNLGTSIRVQVNDVSVIGRNTKGVRLMHVDRQGDERVISVARIAEEDANGEAANT